MGAGLERGAWRTVWLGNCERNVASCAGVMTLESVRNSSSWTEGVSIETGHMA